MTKTMKNYAILLVTLSVAWNLNGGNLYGQTLDSLLHAGRQNNKKLQSLLFKYKELNSRLVQKGQYPATSVGVQLNQVPFSSGNPFRDALSQNLSISQMVPLGGKLSAMTDAERNGLPGIHAETQDAEAQLDATIKMNYLKWASATRKLALLHENEEALNGLGELIKARYSSSQQGENDLLLLQSELAVNKTQCLITEQESEAQKMLLERFTGLQGLRSPDTAALTAAHHVYSDEEIKQLLAEQNPKLRQMQAMMAMNAGEAAANNKELIPDLMVEAMFMRMPQGMPVTTKTSPDMINGMGTTGYMYTIGASITLPFLPWTKKGIEAKTEELEYRNKRIELESADMRDDMYAQVKNLLANYSALEANEKTYQAQVLPSLAEAGNSALRAYQSNAAALTKVLEIRKMEIMEKMNYLMIREEKQMAYAEAEMMLGISREERN